MHIAKEQCECCDGGGVICRFTVVEGVHHKSNRCFYTRSALLLYDPVAVEKQAIPPLTAIRKRQWGNPEHACAWISPSKIDVNKT